MGVHRSDRQKQEDRTMKKITVWDLMTLIVVLAGAGLLIVFARIFINPQIAYNPFPPPTMVPTLEIPTSTATLQSLPPTWTPEHSKGSRAALEATRATLRPSQTAPPSATVPVISINTSTPANTATVPNTPANPSPPPPTRTVQPTQQSQPTDEQQPSPVPDTPVPAQPTTAPAPGPSTLVWKATHETGDISEWQQHGDFIRQGKSAYYTMVTSPVHNGNYAVALTIDTEGYSGSGDFAAYLFYWDQLPGDAYYYSAWYFIPEGTQPQDWWNVWQWKSTYNGNTDNSVPMYALDIREENPGQLALLLIFRPDLQTKIEHRQHVRSVPTGQWFHIEAYYKKGMSKNGQVIVWQDGTEIFNLSGVQTTETDNTVYWSVNHYTDHIIPNPSSIFVDDAAISTERLGPDYVLP
jgi:hypothetical protein